MSQRISGLFQPSCPPTLQLQHSHHMPSAAAASCACFLQPPLQHPINKRSILQDILGLTSQSSNSRPSSAPRQKLSTLELLVQQLLSQQRTTAACAQTSSGTTAAPSSSIQTRPGALAAASTHGSALAAKQPLAGLQDSTQQQEQTWQRRLPAMQQHTQQQHSTISPHSLSGKPEAGLQAHAVSTPQSRQQVCGGSTLGPGSGSRISAGQDMLSELNEQVEVRRELATAAVTPDWYRPAQLLIWLLLLPLCTSAASGVGGL